MKYPVRFYVSLIIIVFSAFHIIDRQWVENERIIAGYTYSHLSEISDSLTGVSQNHLENICSQSLIRKYAFLQTYGSIITFAVLLLISIWLPTMEASVLPWFFLLLISGIGVLSLAKARTHISHTLNLSDTLPDVFGQYIPIWLLCFVVIRLGVIPYKPDQKEMHALRKQMEDAKIHNKAQS